MILSQRRDQPRTPEIRVLKVGTIAAGIAFPHARQAIQITRPHREEGHRRAETVYAITDLAGLHGA